NLAWTCPLSRPAGHGEAWTCNGELRSGNASPMRLAVDLGPAVTSARLGKGAAEVALRRSTDVPDLTRIDLAAVPLAWAQALVAQAWEAGRLGAGAVDGQVRIHSPPGAPLAIDAELSVS